MKWNVWCIRPRFCTVKAIPGQRQPGRAIEMKFVMNHAPGAGSIARPIGQLFSSLPQHIIEMCNITETWHIIVRYTIYNVYTNCILCCCQMITDAAFGYVTDKQLLSHSKYSSGHYKYNFGYRSNATLVDEGFWNNTAWAGDHDLSTPEICKIIYIYKCIIYVMHVLY